MDKENNNVVGRLGSKFDQKCRNGGMRPMPKEAGEFESDSHQREGSSEEVLPNYAAVIAVLGAALVGTIIISLIVSRMWDEDEIKLHILHGAIRFLQSVARTAGSMALECENAYNERVNALH